MSIIRNEGRKGYSVQDAANSRETTVAMKGNSKTEPVETNLADKTQSKIHDREQHIIPSIGKRFAKTMSSGAIVKRLCRITDRLALLWQVSSRDGVRSMGRLKTWKRNVVGLAKIQADDKERGSRAGEGRKKLELG